MHDLLDRRTAVFEMNELLDGVFMEKVRPFKCNVAMSDGRASGVG